MSEPMRVNLTLNETDIPALAKVMAAMPGFDEKGHPTSITPADALRYALHLAAKSKR